MLILAFAAGLFRDVEARAAEACGPKHTDMLYAVVLVDVGRGTGSGTVIYSGEREGERHTYILTNYHVIADAVSVEEEWSPKAGKNVKVERRSSVKANWFSYNDCSRNVGFTGKVAGVVAYDAKADLALLRLKDKEAGVETVAAMIPEDATARLGDEVWAVGAGLGQPPFMTQGTLAYLDKEIDGHRYLLATAPIIFGNSGGALFRWDGERKHFELIGVPSRGSVAGFSIVSHMGWAIPMETVRAFLRANCLGFVVGDETEGSRCSDKRNVEE